MYAWLHAALVTIRYCPWPHVRMFAPLVLNRLDIGPAPAVALKLSKKKEDAKLFGYCLYWGKHWIGQTKIIRIDWHSSRLTSRQRSLIHLLRKKQIVGSGVEAE